MIAGREAMSNVQLADQLCATSTALREVRRRHVSQFGTLLPHVFMSDVLAHVGSCLDSDAGDHTAGAEGEVVDILQLLERGMAGGDRETLNVIAMSFVWDGEQQPFFSRVKPLLGPRARAQLHAS